MKGRHPLSFCKVGRLTLLGTLKHDHIEKLNYPGEAMLKITSLDELTKKLDELGRKAGEMDGKQNVPMNELLNDTFVSRHTRFVNADEMFASSGFKIETQEDFAAIPDDKWDEFIRSVSAFPDWNGMLGTAGKEWVGKKLGL